LYTISPFSRLTVTSIKTLSFMKSQPRPQLDAI
jgi:hypothetical protein